MLRAAILAGAAMLILAGCAPSKFKTYNGPAVTEVRVFKADRKMYLMHGEAALAVYDVALGFAPVGHKQHEGDGRTPEGSYLITRRNPNSRYYLSIGIDYPRPADVTGRLRCRLLRAVRRNCKSYRASVIYVPPAWRREVAALSGPGRGAELSRARRASR